MGKPEVVEKILKDNGFKEILRGNFATDSLQLPIDALVKVKVGDVIVYRKSENGDIKHTGYVSKIEGGKIYIKSKRGSFGAYQHLINAVRVEIYGAYYEIYHNDRINGRLLQRSEKSIIHAFIRRRRE
jgi:hypothetical protein